MSRPINPLSKLRTYSYYHVLTLCDSSQTADLLAKETNPNKWLHPAGPAQQTDREDFFGILGKYAVKVVDEDAGTGTYCVLINGATDAALSIVRAKWTSVTAAETTMLDKSTSIAIEGDLEISEPKGVEFLDIIVNCSLALGVDASTGVFLLKTFFVGHPDTDNLQSDEYYITDVEPIRFITYDVTGSFAEAGGLYQMSFVALAHGATRLPQFGKSASGFNITGGSLSQTLGNLSDTIKNNYDVLFNCVTSTVNDSQLSSLLSRVEYEFSLDDVYNTPKYAVTDGSMITKNAAGCDTNALLSIPANTSIEDAIHIIMKRCPRVTAEMADGVEDDEGKMIHYEYKILSAVESKPGDDGKIRHKVKYIVQRFMRPKDASLFEIAANVAQLDIPVAAQNDLTLVPPDQLDKLSATQQKLRKNLISFDYLYTGKNVDILEFEMKMNLGLAYLQMATINNSLKDQLQPVPTSVTHMPDYDLDKVVRFGKPAQIPVYFGSQIRTPSMRNAQNSSQQAEAGYSLSKHSSIEVQDVTMRIHGNPRLLSTCNAASSPENLGKTPPDQNDNPVTEEADFRDWSTFPSFAKVNIKMPRNNDDISLFRGEAVQNPEAVGGADFTRDFWFTGFYYVVAIEHFFEGGEFTQQLSMIGIPQNDTFKTINKQGKTAAQFELQKKVLNCYDSHLGIKEEVEKTTTTDPKTGEKKKTDRSNVPFTPPGPITSYLVTNLADTNVATRQVDPNSVNGWASAGGVVQGAIRTAAANNKVDLGYMVMLAAAESQFNASASTVQLLTGETKVGLYQFTAPKWRVIQKTFGNELGLPPPINDEEDRKLLALRTSPTFNANAAARLTQSNLTRMRHFLVLNKSIAKENTYAPPATDLYLASVTSAQDAANLIGADQSAPVTTILTNKSEFDVFLANNQSYQNHKTVAAFRAHNAQQLVKNTTSDLITTTEKFDQTSGATNTVSISSTNRKSGTAAQKIRDNTAESPAGSNNTKKTCHETSESDQA